MVGSIAVESVLSDRLVSVGDVGEGSSVRRKKEFGIVCLSMYDR